MPQKKKHQTSFCLLKKLFLHLSHFPLPDNNECNLSSTWPNPVLCSRKWASYLVHPSQTRDGAGFDLVLQPWPHSHPWHRHVFLKYAAIWTKYLDTGGMLCVINSRGCKRTPATASDLWLPVGRAGGGWVEFTIRACEAARWALTRGSQRLWRPYVAFEVSNE